MITNTQKQGFTLIELLIVVAIIGILSSIVLITLSDSGDEAENTKIKYELRQIHTAAIQYKLKKRPRSFGGFCLSKTVEPVFKSLGIDCPTPLPRTTLNSCLINQDIAGCKSKVTNASSSDSWVVYAKKAEGVGYWCVDSKGNIPKEISSKPTNFVYLCPGS